MQFLIDIMLLLVYAFITLLVFAWVWRFWLLYANQKHQSKIDWIMLEIKLPREIFKSPLAMENVLTSLMHSSGIPVWWKRKILGNLPIFSSLEIASIEGTIHFYFRVQRRFRNLVESNLYAQYPGIEIVEAEDYTKLIHYHHLSEDVETWSMYYPLGKKFNPTNPETGQPFDDPKKPGKKYQMNADYLPIKTYVDFGLDRDPKEEFKVDPMVPLLEFMGSIGKGEHIWYQVLVQDESNFNGEKAPKMYVNEITHEHLSLVDLANERKKQIRKIKKVKKGDYVYDENGIPRETTVPKKDGTGSEVKAMMYVDEREIQEKKESQLTIDEKDEIEKINLKLSKPIVRVIVRIIYTAKKEVFNPSYISNTFNVMKNYNGAGADRNNFSISPCDNYDFPWENWLNRRTPWRKEERFEEYVEREGFHIHVKSRESLDKWEDRAFWYFPMKTRKMWRMMYEGFLHPFEHPTSEEIICLNLEELATIFHFPGQTASVPTLPRIDSAKSVAPTNLPQ
ncbi:MAG: hypothetical protein NTW35_01200 [Candidatus Nomurabacteria bacterium]|nr:hypothetical protein [Candidatus Nomurabacteria bacterium]